MQGLSYKELQTLIPQRAVNLHTVLELLVFFCFSIPIFGFLEYLMTFRLSTPLGIGASSITSKALIYINCLEEVSHWAC